MIDEDLNPNMLAFCEEYIKDLNQTQAAIRAGYSEKGASVTGSRLLANVKVRQKIDELKRERSERTKITTDDILFKLNTILNFDPLEIIDENGKMRDLRTVRPELRALIQGIKNGRDGIEVKFMSKERAMEYLAKHLKMFVDQVEVTHSGSITTNDPAQLAAELSELLKSKKKETEVQGE